jgi:hypothetical protein
MRSALLCVVWFLAGCGASQFTTHDPYADAGITPGRDAGLSGGGAGGGTATGGGVGGGSATGGGTGTGGGGMTGCSASTCATGCCANGVCQPGTTSTQCGRGGIACVACSSSDTCGGAQTCSIDPSSTWLVQPTSAVIAPDNGGVSWDDFSDPDPELGLWCPATSTSLTILTKVSDTLTPNWTSGGCTATAAELMADGIGFDAVDIDTFGADTIANFSAAPVSEQDLRAGTITVSHEALTSMTVQLTRQ